MANHTPLPWQQYATMIFSEGNGNICQLSEVRPDASLIQHIKLDICSPNFDEAIANREFILTACNAYYKLLEVAKAIVEWNQCDSMSMESANKLGNIVKSAQVIVENLKEGQ